MIEHILENNRQNLNLVLSLLHAHKSIYPLKLFLNLPCNLNKTDGEKKGIQKKEETKSYLKLEREYIANDFKRRCVQLATGFLF